MMSLVAINEPDPPYSNIYVTIPMPEVSNQARQGGQVLHGRTSMQDLTPSTR